MTKFFSLSLIILFACGPKPQEKNVFTESEIQHAKGFHLETRLDGRYLVVDKPWPNAQEKKEYKLDKPYTRIVCTSTTHLPYFEMLGKATTVVGFPNLKYISSETFVAMGKNGQLTDLGAEGNINLELLIGLQPDAVIAFDMGGESAILDKINEAGIPVIYNADFLESTPLGRAEWIKFFGALLNEEKKADSIFNSITSTYYRLSELASDVKKKPTVLTGVVYGDTWFLPGGQNSAALMYENAGTQYIWADDTTSGWLEHSYEAVFDRAQKADFWIGTASFESLDDLAGSDHRYQDFAPFAAKRVYNYHKKKGPNGGYDYFESAYARPDLVLADLIKIMHPQLLPHYETVYFEQLQ